MKQKKIFVAASITGGREMLPYIKCIIRYLQECGHEVPSIHNGGDDPIQTFVEKVQDPTATDDHSFREWDNRWIEHVSGFVNIGAKTTCITS